MGTTIFSFQQEHNLANVSTNSNSGCSVKPDF